jgi:hypothetical protein
LFLCMNFPVYESTYDNRRLKIKKSLITSFFVVKVIVKFIRKGIN